MKLRPVHNDPFATKRLAVFTFRNEDGLTVTCRCRRIHGVTRWIRNAEALQIRSKVIPGIWKLNKSGTSWTRYSLPAFDFAGSVPAGEVRWAFACRGSSRLADFESYGSGITRWRIVAMERECRRCGKTFEGDPDRQETHCGSCLRRRAKARRALSDREMDAWLDLDNPVRRTRRDVQRNNRWLREFLAKGSFTPAQFKELCASYGNVCLCCGSARPLIPDHVIPLQDGGDNLITNIQPLCKNCNSRKGTACTDYRPKHRRR